MKIYIPTLGRVQKQPTWDKIPEDLRKDTYLVISPEEEEAHREQGRNVLVCPVTGITNVWNWILARSNGPTIMFEDDLYFSRRKDINHWGIRPTTPDDVRDLVHMMRDLLSRGYVHVGIGSRHSDHCWTLKDVPYRLLGRQYMGWGFLPEAMRSLDVKFRLRFISDFDMTLQLLRLGYVNAFITCHTIGQSTGSGTAGGVSTTRTAEAQSLAARELQRLHPQFVQVVQAEAKWGSITKREDVQVSWKRAWNSASVQFGDFSDPKFQEARKPFGLFTPNLVIHEHTQQGVRHIPFSIMNWKKSLKSKTVLYRWAHEAHLQCEKVK